MSTSPTITLHGLPPSHPSKAAEVALRVKGVEFERVEMDMGQHNEQMQAIYGEGNRTVPGMVVDGEPVHGSRAIFARIEEITPDLAAPALPPVPADAWGRLIFTSGTTGRPKAIVHAHGGRWTAHLLQRAVLPFTPGEGDRVLLMTPYVHGASLIAAAWLEQGAEVVLRFLRAHPWYGRVIVWFVGYVDRLDRSDDELRRALLATPVFAIERRN